MSTPIHPQPRRRAARESNPAAQPPTLSKPCLPSSKDMSLRKGATFHTPTSPSSPLDDPILNIRALPSRSLTSPKALEELVAASEKRVQDLLETFERSFSGLGSSVDPDLAHKDVLPVPSFILAHAASNSDLMDRPSKKTRAAERQSAHRHTSDSGLGTSVSTSPRQRAASLSNSSVYSSASKTERALNSTSTSVPTKRKLRSLSEYATRKINLHVIEPLLQEPALKEYHPLVKGIPERISDKSITCLRDLEKTLIFLAPTKASSAASYLRFCESSIQFIHTTVEHLNEIDQRRPTDRPYTNKYFVDLVEQVRAYARIMAISRQKKAKGEKLDDSDYVPGEKLQLKGGIGENGEPAELVREKDGKTVRIDAGYTEMEDVDEDEDELMDDDVTRSMARKRKCDIGKVEYRACRECGKVYTRPCDLTKHEKTHSRPWKCTVPDCKYAEFGWPTEKERDRHINDKHMDAPALYKCLFQPCAYTSKRESNCKQHMEKAHGWEYVRSKSKKGEKLPMTQQSPTTSLIPTPSSAVAFPRLSTPLTSVNDSPSLSNYTAFSPSDSINHPGSTHSMDMTSSHMSPVGGVSHEQHLFDINTFTTGFNTDNTFLSPELSEGRRGSFGTSGTGFTPSSADSFVPPGSFEESFNFQDLNYNFSTMGSFFPMYNIPAGAQQPTPAWSDLDCDFGNGLSAPNVAALHPELSPAGQVDAMFGAPSGLSSNDEAFVDFAQTKPGHSPNDFELFGPNGESSADGAAAGAMFPDLGNVGGVFDGIDMEGYIYGDSK